MIARTDADVIVTKYGRPVVRVSADQTPFESPWAFMRGRAVSDGDSTSPDHALCGTRRLPSPLPRVPWTDGDANTTGTPSRRGRRPHPADGS